jgi:hypothetical protein
MPNNYIGSFERLAQQQHRKAFWNTIVAMAMLSGVMVKVGDFSTATEIIDRIYALADVDQVDARGNRGTARSKP